MKTEFINGTPNDYPQWPDTEGHPINAHDGGMIHVDGVYHWYGLHLRPFPAVNGVEGGQKTTVGVVMYRSEDLYRQHGQLLVHLAPDQIHRRRPNAHPVPGAMEPRLIAAGTTVFGTGIAGGLHHTLLSCFCCFSRP
jgi:hypothetical protein